MFYFPLWLQVVPLSISANILTLVGWLNSLLIFVVLSYYDPHFISSSGAKTVPSWVWLLSAFCTFSAHQLDGIDGKQARRTNSGYKRLLFVKCFWFKYLIWIWDGKLFFLCCFFAKVICHPKKYSVCFWFFFQKMFALLKRKF